jgi:hypothetical protein
MVVVAKQIELMTHSQHKVLLMSDVEKFCDGSGYSCWLTVRSGQFSCERPFCFDDSHLPDAVKHLKQMDSGIPGEATIKGKWEDDFIRFVSNDMGHVEVSGELFEHSELSQSLIFASRTDQTVLRTLIRDLELLLQAQPSTVVDGSN